MGLSGGPWRPIRRGVRRVEPGGSRGDPFGRRNDCGPRDSNPVRTLAREDEHLDQLSALGKEHFGVGSAPPEGLKSVREAEALSPGQSLIAVADEPRGVGLRLDSEQKGVSVESHPPGVGGTDGRLLKDVSGMGFLSRMFVPRGVRRALNPVRTVKAAVTPKPLKRIRRAMHPLDNAVYGVSRAINTKPRRKSRSTVYRHGSCPVAHRSPEAAARCRNP